MQPLDVVLGFMDCINRGDSAGLGELMSTDHAFFDSAGNVLRGREEMLKAWKGYFALFPDYWVSHDGVLIDGNTVAVFGSAGGTLAGSAASALKSAWQTPAAWLGIVEDGLVKEWRVYADQTPVHAVLARSAEK